jgi:hypothetical protein
MKKPSPTKSDTLDIVNIGTPMRANLRPSPSFLVTERSR